MLRTTDNDYPEFLAALSILFGLPPDEARAELELRAQRLSAELAEAQAELASLPPELPRLFLLEEEYRAALLSAEVAFLSRVIEDLKAGQLKVFAAHQPLTYMVDAVRALTLGPDAQALLGHPASYFVVRALIWTAGILVVALPVAVMKYRRG